MNLPKSVIRKLRAVDHWLHSGDNLKMSLAKKTVESLRNERKNTMNEIMGQKTSRSRKFLEQLGIAGTWLSINVSARTELNGYRHSRGMQKCPCAQEI